MHNNKLNISGYLKHLFIAMRKDVRLDRYGRRLKPKKVQSEHLFLFPALFVYFEILFRAFGQTLFFPNLIYPVIFAVSFGFFLTFILMNFSPRVISIATKILIIVFACIYVMEILIKRTFMSYMTWKQIFDGAGGVVTGYTSDMFKAITGGFFILVLYALPIVLYYIFSRRYVRPHQYKFRFSVAFLIISLFFFAIGTVLSATGSTKSKYDEQYNFTSACETFGLITGYRLDAAYAGRTQTFIMDGSTEALTSSVNSDATSETVTEQIVLGDNIMDINFAALAESESDPSIKSIHTYVNSLTPSNKNEYTGLFKGKNLILICAEAFCPSFVNEDLTPTLYRMIHNGFYFSDYYQPTWGGSTLTGEYSFLLGLIPVDGLDSIYETVGHNMYFTMGNQLQRLDYYNMAIHDGDYDYYERQTTHYNFGYETWLGYGNGLEDITGEWVGDQVTFDLTMDLYTDETPFSIYYMTISGHCTYDGDDPKVSEYWDLVDGYFGDMYMDVTKYYICYQMQLEDALETMINKLEEQGLADDTVICLTADHYPYGLEYGAFGNEEDYVTDLYGHSCLNPWENDGNALIIWSGCLENEVQDMWTEISTPTYSLDILPTLSNLFGLEYDSRLLPGRDVFSDTDPLVIWPNYSWKTDKGIYNSEDGSFYAADGVILDDEQAYIDRINNVVNNKFTFSANVLYEDYYGILFGSDPETN